MPEFLNEEEERIFTEKKRVEEEARVASNEQQIAQAVEAGGVDVSGTPVTDEQGRATGSFVDRPDVFDPSQPKSASGTIPDLKTLEAMNLVNAQRKAVEMKAIADERKAQTTKDNASASKIEESSFSAELKNIESRHKGRLVAAEVRLDAKLRSQSPANRYSFTDIQAAMSSPTTAHHQKIRSAFQTFNVSIRNKAKRLQEEETISLRLKAAEEASVSKRAGILLQMQSLTQGEDEAKFRREAFEQTQITKKLAIINVNTRRVNSESAGMQDKLTALESGGVMSNQAFNEFMDELKAPGLEQTKKLVESLQETNKDNLFLLEKGVSGKAKLDKASVFIANAKRSKSIAAQAKVNDELGLTAQQNVDNLAKTQSISKEDEPAFRVYAGKVIGRLESTVAAKDEARAYLDASEKSGDEKTAMAIKKIELGSGNEAEELVSFIYPGVDIYQSDAALSGKTTAQIKLAIVSAIKSGMNDNGNVMNITESKSLDADLENINSEVSRAVASGVNALRLRQATVDENSDDEVNSMIVKSIKHLQPKVNFKIERNNIISIPQAEASIFVPSPSERIRGTDITRGEHWKELIISAHRTDRLDEIANIIGESDGVYGNKISKTAMEKLDKIVNFDDPPEPFMNQLNDKDGDILRNIKTYGGEESAEIIRTAGTPEWERTLKSIYARDFVDMSIATAIDDNGDAFGKGFSKIAGKSTVASAYDDGPRDWYKSIDHKYDSTARHKALTQEYISSGIKDGQTTREMKRGIKNTVLIQKKVGEKSGGKMILDMLSADGELKDNDLHDLKSAGTKFSLLATPSLAREKLINNMNLSLYQRGEGDIETGLIQDAINLSKGFFSNGSTVAQIFSEKGIEADSVSEALALAQTASDNNDPDWQFISSVVSSVIQDIDTEKNRIITSTEPDADTNLKGIHAISSNLGELGTGPKLSDDPVLNARKIREYVDAIKILNEIVSIGGLEETRKQLATQEKGIGADARAIASAQTAFFTGKQPPSPKSISAAEEAGREIRRRRKVSDQSKLQEEALKIKNMPTSDEKLEAFREFAKRLREYDDSIDPQNFINRSDEVEPFSGLE